MFEGGMYQELEVAVRVGDILVGKYRVDRVLGVGGVNVVITATHLHLNQVVALKFVRAEALHSPEIVGRFDREARVAVRLKSEHLARIIDVGRPESGLPYIVMDYLEGQDLVQLLEQRRSLPVAIACDYIIQECDAIAEVHSLGIVYRDLKLENLFLATTSHGQQVINVVDFGISKTQGPTDDINTTRTQAVQSGDGLSAATCRPSRYARPRMSTAAPISGRSASSFMSWSLAGRRFRPTRSARSA